MTIGERIKEVRKSNKLTLEKFGAAIQIKAQSVSMIERGINNPSNQTITLICSRFNVSEEWLRTGAGEMSAKSYEDELEKMCAERGLSHADYVAIRKIMEMPKAARDAVTAFMLEFAAEVAYAPAPPPRVQSKADAPARLSQTDPEKTAREEAAELLGLVEMGIEDERAGEKRPESGVSPAGSGTTLPEEAPRKAGTA